MSHLLHASTSGRCTLCSSDTASNTRGSCATGDLEGVVGAVIGDDPSSENGDSRFPNKLSGVSRRDEMKRPAGDSNIRGAIVMLGRLSSEIKAWIGVCSSFARSLISRVCSCATVKGLDPNVNSSSIKTLVKL